MKLLVFSDDMMRALEAGQKAMTRRPANFGVWKDEDSMRRNCSVPGKPLEILVDEFGVTRGPRLKIRDLVAATCAFNHGSNPQTGDWTSYRFQFGKKDLGLFGDWFTARIMPASLAPFVLRITEVRAEKLGEITDADAEREGMAWLGTTSGVLGPETAKRTARRTFAAYWEILYGSGAWERDANSWVWVYGFEVAERRIP